MNQKHVRIVFIAATVIVCLSLAAVGGLLGTRMASTPADTSAAPQTTPPTEAPTVTNEQPSETVETVEPEDEPEPSVTTLRVAVAAEAEKEDQEKLAAALAAFAEGFAAANPGLAVELVYGKDVPATVTGTRDIQRESESEDVITCSMP